MRTRLIAATLFATLALAPSVVSAQEDLPPDRMPTDQVAPVDEDRPSAIGACGSDAAVIVDRSTIGVTPAGPEDAPKDVVGNRQVNLSSVEGTITHLEGDLMLVRLAATRGPQNTPALGQQRQNEWAVVRLPAGCVPSPFGEGAGVLAVGTASDDGILRAESVQPGPQ
jgi:hypothetical protein